MKLYYCPWACSLASHIVLNEAEIPFESESVDLKAKVTASGADFNAINPKSYVPALILDDEELVTENIAVLDYLAERFPQFAPIGALARTRLVEALAYLSTEVHKSFKAFWHGGTSAEQTAASAYIYSRLQYLADRMQGTFIFGDEPTVADYYAFTMVLWSERFGVPVPARLEGLRAAMMRRPAVIKTLELEGIQLAA